MVVQQVGVPQLLVLLDVKRNFDEVVFTNSFSTEAFLEKLREEI